MQVSLPDPGRCTFLDVEHTPRKKTMVIGLFHIAYGYRPLYKTAWRERIDSELIRDWFDKLTRAKGVDTLVTYSGTEYDVRMLRKEPEIDLLAEFPLRHFDLFEAAGVLKAARKIRKKGLKVLEERFGIFRPALYGEKRETTQHLFGIVEGMTFDPNLSPETALERLLTYNYFDTVNLYFLLCRLRDEYGETLDSDDLSARS
jgi:uncharacterized protein YprB with RNaseH-like and TPR domain